MWDGCVKDGWWFVFGCKQCVYAGTGWVYCGCMCGWDGRCVCSGILVIDFCLFSLAICAYHFNSIAFAHFDGFFDFFRAADRLRPRPCGIHGFSTCMMRKYEERQRPQFSLSHTRFSFSRVIFSFVLFPSTFNTLCVDSRQKKFSRFFI